MAATSLTGTALFTARLLRSERWRIWLMVAALLVTLMAVLVRRAIGGVVMSANAVYIPTIILIALGLIYQGIALLIVRRRARLGGAIPTWQRALSVAMDLAVPALGMLILQLHSPRGALAVLSAPVLLLMPLVILLSVLRLHPWFSFWTGASAALIHAALVARATQITEIASDLLPLLYSYSVLLLVTGAAAAVVSWMSRRYVIEAVDEATASERALRAVALIEQDLRVAHDIQMGLLPSERPTIAGFDVAGMARPAAHAGGDYYDWQPLPDGRLVVAIADVTGHGIGPALVMAVCRAYARASAPTSAGPDALLRQLNELIFEDVKGARFITMVLAVISGNGDVELVSAGHGPTLLFHAATKEVEWFGGDGLPLGVMSDEQYGPRRALRLQSGDVLVMLTDGFFEHARSGDGEQFGVDRLTSALRENAAKSPAEIIAAIDQSVREFAAGAAQADDMTAVAIKRK